MLSLLALLNFLLYSYDIMHTGIVELVSFLEPIEMKAVLPWVTLNIT